MRAILIDPVARQVSEVEHNGDYRNIYKLIDCSCFTVVCIAENEKGEHEDIFVDDEGLLNDPTHFFQWADYGQPLAGKGLILGCDGEGESVATKLTLEYVKSKVTFPVLKFEGFGPPHTEKNADMPFGGKGFFINTGNPHFMEVAPSPYWHEFNPWAESIQYVSIDALDLICSQSVGQERGYFLGHWKQHGDKLDAYILPQPSGRHSVGIRYGRDGNQYLSPHADSARVQMVLDIIHQRAA